MYVSEFYDQSSFIRAKRTAEMNTEVFIEENADGRIPNQEMRQQ